MQLHPRSDELNFMQNAKGQGLHRLGGPLDDGGIGVLVDALLGVTNQ